jgi:hypothetical protein
MLNHRDEHMLSLDFEWEKFFAQACQLQTTLSKQYVNRVSQKQLD